MVTLSRILFGKSTAKNKRVMKKNILMNAKSSFVRLMVLPLALLGVTGCVETIDDSNAVIKEGDTMSEYLAKHPEYSHIKALFDEVRLGEKTSTSGDSISSITSVLSARGNYTLFAPTNEAVEKYVKSLKGDSVFDLNLLTYEEKQMIAYNCVIDNEDEAAYETPDFSASGSFGKTNFFDRILTYAQDEEGNYVIESSSKIIMGLNDIEVENGVIHIVDSVIAPSDDLIWDLFSEAPNMVIMSKLFEITGWAQHMSEVGKQDKPYSIESHLETMKLTNVVDAAKVPQKRYLGFTAFVEPDSLLIEDWDLDVTWNENHTDILNWDAVLGAIQSKCEEAYGTAASGVWNDQSNAVNRFVAYHLIEGRVAHDRFCTHYNEFRFGYGTDRKNPKVSAERCHVDVWDYYMTVGEKPELLKVTHVGNNDNPYAEMKLCINRVYKHHETTFKAETEIAEGIDVFEWNDVNGKRYANNGGNGFYYPISKILICDATTRNNLTKERIRFDYVTMMPEMASNNLRQTGAYGFENGYFQNVVKATDETRTFYVREGYTNATGGWSDYQGDEFLFSGIYDFTLKLPPVPKSGQYEVRMGVSTNNLRGMAQLYFGTDPDRLTPAGLPFDMRLGAQDDTKISWAWKDDREADEITRIENDKALRSAGYMKGPAYVTVASEGGVSDIKNASVTRYNHKVLRRIVATQWLEQNQNYYLRVKSALSADDSQLFIDYFEYVPVEVYNGGEAEDIW